MAHTDRDVGATKTMRNAVGLGYDYYLSKRTDVYGVYLRDRLGAYGAAGSLAVGLRHRF